MHGWVVDCWVVAEHRLTDSTHTTAESTTNVSDFRPIYSVSWTKRVALSYAAAESSTERMTTTTPTKTTASNSRPTEVADRSDFPRGSAPAPIRLSASTISDLNAEMLASINWESAGADSYPPSASQKRTAGWLVFDPLSPAQKCRGLTVIKDEVTLQRSSSCSIISFKHPRKERGTILIEAKFRFHPSGVVHATATEFRQHLGSEVHRRMF